MGYFWQQILGLGLMLGFWVLPVTAGTVTPAERQAIHKIIQQQLTAFQQDNASQAFALASPGIQQQFETAKNFITMVKAAYPAVYRPRSVMFEDLTELRGVVTQIVLLMAPDGTLQRAFYPMEKQRNGSWRINGCYLIPLGGAMT